MPTLRDRVREALARREPNEGEAREDLDAILARSKGAGRGGTRLWPLVAGPALAAALLLLYLVYPRGALPPPVPAPTASRGVHIYLHVSGEPAGRAMNLDLDSKGDL